MSDFWHEYLHILSDPAHLAVEVTLMLLLDVLLLGLIVPFMTKWIKRSISREHTQIDSEHGVYHHGDHIHSTPDTQINPTDCGWTETEAEINEIIDSTP